MTDGGLPVPALVDVGYRKRFLLKLCGIIAGGAVLLYLALLAIFSRPLTGDYRSVFYALRHMAGFLWPILALAVLAFVLLVCAATAVVCIYALHKVAGPLYRRERVLDDTVDGKTVKAVFFRAGDQAMLVAEAFTAFVGALRTERQGWIARMERAESLCLQDEATCRAERAKALDEIAARLARYR